MQLVLSNNRVIAYGENFLVKGDNVINTETGVNYENATVAECDGCPSDIDKVGYEYHGGSFKPCAPYGTGNNNGYFMEVCEDCATPRNSGIPIKGGITLEHLSDEVTGLALGSAEIVLLWENASPSSNFSAQTVTITEYDWDFLIIEHSRGFNIINDCVSEHKSLGNGTPNVYRVWGYADDMDSKYYREIEFNSETKLYFGNGREYTYNGNDSTSYYTLTPLKVYGVKKGVII